jgi:hypothetical protein
MSDALSIYNPTSALTQEEAEFVYNCEVLGLPAKKAAGMAGLAMGNIGKPHLLQAREVLKKEMQARLKISKEDLVNIGMDAIDMARMMSDPETMIKGVAQVSKMMGFDAPQQVNVNHSASVEVLRDHVRNMTDEEIARELGSDTIIDGDFYEIGKS